MFNFLKKILSVAYQTGMETVMLLIFVDVAFYHVDKNQD